MLKIIIRMAIWDNGALHRELLLINWNCLVSNTTSGQFVCVLNAVCMCVTPWEPLRGKETSCLHQTGVICLCVLGTLWLQISNMLLTIQSYIQYLHTVVHATWKYYFHWLYTALRDFQSVFVNQGHVRYSTLQEMAQTPNLLSLPLQTLLH